MVASVLHIHKLQRIHLSLAPVLRTEAPVNIWQLDILQAVESWGNRFEESEPKRFSGFARAPVLHPTNREIIFPSIELSLLVRRSRQPKIA